MTLHIRFIRIVLLLCSYTAILGVSLGGAYALRFDFHIPAAFAVQMPRVFLIALVTKILLLIYFREFGSLLYYFSIPDLLRIAGAMMVGCLVPYLGAALWSDLSLPPRGVMLADFVLSVCAICSIRLCLRLYRERISGGRFELGRPFRRVCIYGAGDAGANFAAEILRKPHLGLKPTFFLDDDVRKVRRRIHGIPVLGGHKEIEELCRHAAVDTCVIAMPSAPVSRVQEIVKEARRVGIKVEIIPSLTELATGRVTVTKIRPVDLEDLLGRAEENLISPIVRALIAAKVVAVTGAGGSIGSELCRQIARLGPSKLLLIERCEVQIFLIEQELNGDGFSDIVVPIVADIRDMARMHSLFERYQPEVIFHAAAHKHVPMMESQPFEAVQNNAFGTRDLAELANAFCVKKFILISTDKAVNPTNVMGATKRLAELFLQAFQKDERTTTKYAAVRFGNVLGSSGSVIPTFKRQIAAGGPVTVTHPDMTRFFMTIPEAAGLVLHAAAFSEDGEIYVLDMGRPVKIVELARQLIELSGLRPEVDIAIKFTGLRPGEKIYEELTHSSELVRRTEHEKILRFDSTPRPLEKVIAEFERLKKIGFSGSPGDVKEELQRIVPEYTPDLKTLLNA